MLGHQGLSSKGLHFFFKKMGPGRCSEYILKLGIVQEREGLSQGRLYQSSVKAWRRAGFLDKREEESGQQMINWYNSEDKGRWNGINISSKLSWKQPRCLNMKICLRVNVSKSFYPGFLRKPIMHNWRHHTWVNVGGKHSAPCILDHLLKVLSSANLCPVKRAGVPF